MSVDASYVLYEIETWFSYVVTPANNTTDAVATIPAGDVEATVTSTVTATIRSADTQGEQ